MIGVIDSKHAPIPKIDDAMKLIEETQNGFISTLTNKDGTNETVTEGA